MIQRQNHNEAPTRDAAESAILVEEFKAAGVIIATAGV